MPCIVKIIISATNSSAKMLSSIMLKNLLKNHQYTEQAKQFIQSNYIDLCEATKLLVINAVQSSIKPSSLFISEIITFLLENSINSQLFFQFCDLINEKSTTIQNKLILASLSYIADSLRMATLANYVDKLLFVIINVIQTEKDEECLVNCYVILQNIILLAKQNMQKESQRNVIIMYVIYGLNSQNEHIIASSLIVANKIINQYYSYAEPIINCLLQLLLNITSSTPRQNIIQIISAWVDIAIYELTIAHSKSKKFIASNVKLLVSKIFSFFTYKEFESDGDCEAQLSSATSALLSRMTNILGKDIIEYTQPQIAWGLSSSTEQTTISSLLALSAIIEGDPKITISLFTESLDCILKLLDSKSINILIFTTSCLSKACDKCPAFICKERIFDKLNSTLFPMINHSVGKIAANICMCYYYIASTITDVYNGNMMIPKIIGTLSGVYLRDDCLDDSLRLGENASLAIANISRCSRSNQINYHIFAHILPMLKTTLTNEKKNNATVQIYMCFILYNVVSQLNKCISTTEVEDLLSVIISLYRKHKCTFEEGNLICSRLSFYYPQIFIKYIPNLGEHLKITLSSTESVSLFKSAQILFNDCIREAKEGMSSYIESIIDMLFAILKDENAIREIKVCCIELIGDIFLTGTNVDKKYYDHAYTMILSACRQSLEQEACECDEEEQENNIFVDELLGALLDCLSAIVVTAKEQNVAADTVKYCNELASTSIVIGNKYMQSSSGCKKIRVKQSVLAIGDIIDTYNWNNSEQHESIAQLMGYMKSSGSCDNVEIACIEKRIVSVM